MQIFNTLTRKKEEFIPLTPNTVKMYVCGMTVYDLSHIGHARVMVVFDLISRWFRHLGYNVTYVRNITDIDDKIIDRANKQGISISDLTTRFISEMDKDSESLNIQKPDLQPKATEHILDMIAMIATLISKGFAYVGANGDVYYRVSAFSGYGKLSGKQIESLQAGVRHAVDNSFKESPLDFVLWKAAKPFEPAWESPWGSGRPGWHIECSAMSSAHLGSQFDIHGGGQDLEFPHHENEIAQSEATHGCQMANYWVHNGFVNVDDTKMSKSLGNFFTIQDVLKSYDPEVLRFFILKSHYRSPLNYSDFHLNEAKAGLTRLYSSVRFAGEPEQDYADVGDNGISEFVTRFNSAMNDDFNSADAISVLFEMAYEINLNKSKAMAHAMLTMARTIGLMTRNPSVYFQGATSKDNSLDIDSLIKERDLLKKNKQYKEADDIRNTLKSEGILLEDTPAGTIWKYQSS